MNLDKNMNKKVFLNKYICHVLESVLYDLFPKKLKIINKEIFEDKFYIDFNNEIEISSYDFAEIEKKIKAKIVPENKHLNEFFVKENVNFFILKYFKLLSLSSSQYNKNDEQSINLKRIYGKAFKSKKDLKIFIFEQEKEKTQDHRFLNKKLNYFMFSDLVGAGLPILLEKAVIVKNLIREEIHHLENFHNYRRVETPVLATRKIYEISGHLKNYSKTMFPTIKLDHEDLILRPMTCPHHCQIFDSKIISYNDLPFRICEDANLFRYEYSGGLKGIERVRSMVLADSHVFISNNLLKNELKNIISMIKNFLFNFNIEIDYYRLSISDKNKSKFKNNNLLQKEAEEILVDVLTEMNIPYELGVGEAAFYGPKIDIQIKTKLNTDITISTVQLDYILPEKFNLNYIDDNNQKIHPILIHHGIIGTYERFISILLEQSQGLLPLWLAPIQIAIIPINNDIHLMACQEINEIFLKNGFRTKLYGSDDRFNKKIFLAQNELINYFLILGDRNIKSETISIRTCKNKKTTDYKIFDLINILKREIINKGKNVD